ncbi:TRAP transporter substrate-binding protein [Propionivibrio limicola]|uniref:TRAP transporter substrate-binding protein n=1 Tax=Propionivibrio limicola TaxID=167645 RepID=UPI0012912461|nr:TRAP transporter substrate-binding protein [Propionivibrio limicola]
MISKKVISVAVAAACGLIVAGGAQAEIRKQSFRFSTANPKGHPIPAGAEKFGALLSQKSGGKMSVKSFPGGVLGGDVQVLSAVQGGTIDIAAMNTGLLQGQIKEAAIVDLPFLFANAKEADAVLDGKMGQKLADLMPAKGLVNLGYFDLGFRQVTNSKRPIKTAEDIVGLKLRVVQSPTYIETFNALGANAVPMPFTEVYTALEQRMIDGQENPFSVIEVNKINEVQKYLSVTNHMYNPQSFFMSKKTWDKLNADEQKVVMEAAKEATVWQRQFSRDTQAKALVNLKKTSEVNDVPAAEIAKLRAKVKPVIDKFATSIGPEFVKEFLAEIEKVRAGKN